MSINGIDYTYVRGLELPFSVAEDEVQHDSDFSFPANATQDEISQTLDAFLADVVKDLDLITFGWSYEQRGPHTDGDWFHIGAKRLVVPVDAPLGAGPDGVLTSEEVAQLRTAADRLGLNGDGIEPTWVLVERPSN